MCLAVAEGHPGVRRGEGIVRARHAAGEVRILPVEGVGVRGAADVAQAPGVVQLHHGFHVHHVALDHAVVAAVVVHGLAFDLAHAVRVARRAEQGRRGRLRGVAVVRVLRPFAAGAADEGGYGGVRLREEDLVDVAFVRVVAGVAHVHVHALRLQPQLGRDEHVVQPPGVRRAADVLRGAVALGVAHRHAEAQGVADGAGDGAVQAAAVEGGELRQEFAAELPRRLLADEIDRPAHRVAPVQRALRPAQHLHPLQVEHAGFDQAVVLVVEQPVLVGGHAHFGGGIAPRLLADAADGDRVVEAEGGGGDQHLQIPQGGDA